MGRRIIRPMPHSPTPTDLEARITELEIKLGFMDDLVETLNDQMARQQQMIALLQRELLRVSDQVQDTGAPAFRSLRDELPPHY
jgi:SlyX protein